MISQLGDLVGRGSDGDIYSLRKNKIIKFISKDKINFLELFILLHLNSNYLMKALQVEIGETNIKIVQNKAKYDLGQLISFRYEESYFTFAEKIKYIRQAITGVYFLNLHNLIHGDIKPQNILVFNNFIKLNDFNLTRDCKFSNSNRKLYTLNYRPPESNNYKYSLKSDIWALGCTIYEIYYGKKYFLSDNKGKLFHLACTEERKKENHFINKIVKEMIKENEEERIDIEKVIEYFTIKKLEPNYKLKLKNDFPYKDNKKFIEILYLKDKIIKDIDKKIMDQIINKYNFSIFELIK